MSIRILLVRMAHKEKARESHALNALGRSGDPSLREMFADILKSKTGAKVKKFPRS